MSWHFICLTSQSHRTRMISIIKWHLTIKHPKGIPSEPHILPFKFATDASILHIFEGYWAKNTSWMEVLAKDMPSWRVKIIFEMVCELREGGALRFIISTFAIYQTLHWLGVINSCINFPNVVKNKTQKQLYFLTKFYFVNLAVIVSEIWLAESRIQFRSLSPIRFYLFYFGKQKPVHNNRNHNFERRECVLTQSPTNNPWLKGL